MKNQNENLPGPQLSKIRTFLFGALIFVWFSEMVLWGAFAKEWTTGSNMFPPDHPQLATSLYITHAVEAAAKGALGVLAVCGLLARNVFARTVLFFSMALVPPLNLAFPFREQGFPMKWTVIATVFSIILWGSFLLVREKVRPPEQKEDGNSVRLPASRREVFQTIWFSVYSAVLTSMAFLFLFAPVISLNFIFPCLSGLFESYKEEISSLVFSNLFNATHLFALATASWIATIYSRSNSTLRKSLTLAAIVHTGLLCLLPLTRITMESGLNCATSSILIVFVPLFAGWVIYAGFSYKAESRRASPSRKHRTVSLFNE